MIERFTAQNARSATVTTALDYNNVVDDIKILCSKGRNELFWPWRAVDKGTVILLEQDGFRVEVTRCHPGGDSTYIAW